LNEGPVDIIGDVHGEFTVLEKLLAHLGYDDDGHSESGRTLVFLGDLVDNGPNSPAVLEKVMALVSTGKAQCIMGNHELYLLLDKAIHGNGWMIQPNRFEKPGDYHSVPADPENIGKYLKFIEALPLALENDSLRLVHACWHEPSINRLRGGTADTSSPADLFFQLEAEVLEILGNTGLITRMNAERREYGVCVDDPEWAAKLIPAHAEVEVLSQMLNPIRVLTTSEVKLASEPYFASGRWRLSERTKWWDRYSDDVPVIIGHFWRQFSAASERISGVFGKDVFEGIPTHAWLGQKGNVYCVDYSVGQLHAERQKNPGSSDTHGKLAALRYPEWEVHHDDGTVVSIDPPASQMKGRVS
jgi:hypothetical protein